MNIKLNKRTDFVNSACNLIFFDNRGDDTPFLTCHYIHLFD
jgi:hypothetical protein